MRGALLPDLHRRLDALATGGPYRVACVDTGERPYPVADQTYPDRDAASHAADLASTYRARLREYDPRARTHALGVRRVAGDRVPRREACSRLAGALFDALGEVGATDVERSVLDTYLAAATDTTSPDALGVALLETIARVLDDALTPARQHAVVERAIDRLDARPATAERALDRLRTGSLLSAYTYRTHADRLDVRLDGYALGIDADDRLPTLPLTVAFARTDGTVAVTDARRTTRGSWRLAVSLDADAPAGVARTPVRPC